MRKLVACCLLLALIGSVVAHLAWAEEPVKKNPKLGLLRHVVIFKFKDSATPEQIKSVEDAFRALPSKIPEIVGFEWGTNNSPEAHSQGYTHCFFLTFKNAEDRAVYLPHPAHREFGKVLRPYLDKVMVIDYVAQE